MPSRLTHLQFDEILREKGIISEDTDGSSVHNRMDKGSNKYGANHRVEDPFHNPEGIREFINNMVNSLGTISQKTATDYVRIAYGHLCLDYMTTKLKDKNDWSDDDIDWETAFERAYNFYRTKGFHKTYYKYINKG